MFTYLITKSMADLPINYRERLRAMWMGVAIDFFFGVCIMQLAAGLVF